MIFSLQAPQSTVKLMQEVLSPKQFEQAMFQAVKRTTGTLRTRISREIRTRSYAKRDAIDDAVTVEMPRREPGQFPTGRVVISEKPLPLIDFRARVSKRAGVIVRTGPNAKPMSLRHAFAATMKSGHEGIFLRGRRLPSKGPNKGKGKLTRQGFAGRFIIVELVGPSIFSMLNVQEVLDSIALDTQEVLAKNLWSQIDRFQNPRS